MSNQTCQKWFAKFRVGDVSLDNAPWSGRPVEVGSDQVKTLIENNQHYTTQETADILKIPILIKLFVNMKNLSFMEKLNQTFWLDQYIVLVTNVTPDKFKQEERNAISLF